MARRLDIELTSRRDDDTWTWRAAGAKQPKGELDASLLAPGASVGDTLRVEIESDVDGMVVTSIVKQRERNGGPEVLELLGSGSTESGVTTQLAPKGRRGRSRERSDDARRRPRSDAPRGAKRQRRDERERRDERASKPRSQRPDRPPRSRPKRLKPKRTHRKAVVSGYAEELRPLAETLVRGGVPTLRKNVDAINSLAASQGRGSIDVDVLVALSERMLPALRAAEWKDRAEAALAGLDEVDLRDLRSVVVAADGTAKDDEARALAETLRGGLTQRVDNEHRAWLSELAELLTDGRTVRALRHSSRPPKAGVPLPADLAERLSAAANEGMTSETGSDRWAVVLEAVAFSPVRSHVRPQGVPPRPTDALLTVVKKTADRVPQVAAMFGSAEEPRSAPRSR